MWRQEGCVHTRPGGAYGLVELAQRLPGELAHRTESEFDPALEELLEPFVGGGGAQAAVATHDRGHTLGCFEVQGGVVQQRHVVVGVDVDEAGGDREAGHVDHARRLAIDGPDRRDASAGDRDIGLALRRAGTVDDVAAADEYVVSRAAHCVGQPTVST